MNPSNALFRRALPLAILFGVGYLVGSQFKQDQKPESATQDYPDAQAKRDSQQASFAGQSPQGALPLSSRLNASEIYALDSHPEMLLKFEQLLKSLDSNGLETLFEEIASLPPSPRRSEMMKSLFQDWGEKAGESAYLYAQSLSGHDRLEYLAHAAGGWAAMAPQAAWEAIMDATNNGSLSRPTLWQTLESISEGNMQLAVDLMADIGDPRKGAAAIDALVRKAANDGNIPALLEAVERSGAFEDKTRLVRALFRGWGTYDFDSPYSAISKIKDPELQEEAMSGIMLGWAQSDGKGAFEYALENSEDAAIAKLMPEIAQSWAYSATAAEVGEIMERAAGTDNEQQIMRRIIWPLAQANPRAAADWATQQSEESRSNRSVYGVMNVWGRSDLPAATQYLSTVADENSRSRAATPLVYHHLNAKSDPDEVIALSRGFESQKASERVLSRIVSMLSSPHVSADTSVLRERLLSDIPQRSDISEETRQKLIGQLEDTGQENG